jgi:hypothetical protein
VKKDIGLLYNMEYNRPLFNEPIVDQVGSHMIMSNVVRPLKKKYCNIDTRFRDDYDSIKNPSVIITLPQRITKVRSMRITNAEIPFSYYNVSTSNKNNSIVFTDNTGTETLYTLANGYYNPTSILYNFNTYPINSYIQYVQHNNYFSQFVFTPSGSVTSMTMQFSVDPSGNFNRFELKNTLGWLLGFRSASYTFTSTNKTITSEAMMDFNIPKYMYIVVDEFTQNTNDNTFVAPLYRSIINKNIFARINTSLFSLTICNYGNILTPNEKDGTLVSDKRTYHGVDLQKLRVELVNEFGNAVNLNGLDFSFCLEIECD